MWMCTVVQVHAEPGAVPPCVASGECIPTYLQVLVSCAAITHCVVLSRTLFCNATVHLQVLQNAHAPCMRSRAQLCINLLCEGGSLWTSYAIL